MNGIDPKWGALLNIVATVCALVAAGTVAFVGIPANVVDIIKTTALDLFVVIGAVNSVLHLYSAPAPGPMIPAPSVPPAVKAAIILALAMTALLAFGGDAHAQALKPPQITGNIAADTKANFGPKNAHGASSSEVSCDFNIFTRLSPQNLEDVIKKCVSDVNSTIADDVARALDSAQNFKPEPDQDAINCLKPGLAIIQAGVQVPAVPAQDAVPATASSPAVPAIAAVPAKNPGLILLFQKYREFTLSGALTSCRAWINGPLNATVAAGLSDAAGVAGVAGAAAVLIPK